MWPISGSWHCLSHPPTPPSESSSACLLISLSQVETGAAQVFAQKPVEEQSSKQTAQRRLVQSAAHTKSLTALSPPAWGQQGRTQTLSPLGVFGSHLHTNTHRHIYTVSYRVIYSITHEHTHSCINYTATTQIQYIQWSHSCHCRLCPYEGFHLAIHFVSISIFFLECAVVVVVVVVTVMELA